MQYAHVQCKPQEWLTGLIRTNAKKNTYTFIDLNKYTTILTEVQFGVENIYFQNKHKIWNIMT
uniref:Uncharacterized protein n=1 Tax=Arion vulgaris TaxID=1028688 RepID=A0A0B7B253_9EUPU